ncbi:MAG TPA: SDR family NAD(P)-dependent oxidoreductase [Solirubrobacteraceae bacterium]|nr:SDR family NAD(P)-dependent oxidoreductase [Solirubrobacteraceae bacterium]
MTDVPTYPDLAGKVAVVTGGSKGIGAATCVLLGHNQARVAVHGRDEEAIDAVVNDTRAAGGDAIAVTADVTTPEGVAHLREQVESQLGPADILMIFAGGFGARTPLVETSLDEWRDVVESNLTSTFLTLKEFAPGMTERGSGSIVTMASNAARFLDIKLTASYAAAKAGIAMLSRHAALELGPDGVRVNCLAPATILTARVERVMDEERRAAIAAMSPLGRLGAPEDPALAALFLASESARWLTGVTLDVAGGRIMM